MTRKRYASVFNAIADTPQETVNLRLRAEVMRRGAELVLRPKAETGAELFERIRAKHGMPDFAPLPREPLRAGWRW